jgi:hypothetical protein
VFRYPRRISRFEVVCSSFTARIASRTFRASECSAPVRTFFTYCWVMVDPPWLIDPLVTFAHVARATATKSRPSCR